MNFVPGQLQRDGQGQVVTTPWGEVNVTYVSDIIKGNTVKLGFRPEDVVIGDMPGWFSFSAKVTQSYYIGDTVLCELTAHGCAFSARLPNTTNVKNGDDVRVSVKHEDFTVFTNETT
jgi:ABC-type sugar transport system ATPase subunit